MCVILMRFGMVFMGLERVGGLPRRVPTSQAGILINYSMSSLIITSPTAIVAIRLAERGSSHSKLFLMP